MSSTICTVFFDGTFWVAVIESYAPDTGLTVARHVFGAEPTNAELLDWAAAFPAGLRFSEPQATDQTPIEHAPQPNPKRKARQAAKAQQQIGASPLAHAALQVDLKQRKAEKAARQRIKAEQTAGERHAHRLARAKEKHRGH